MLHRKIGWMLLCSAVLLASCNDDETNGNGGNGPAVPPAEVTADVDYEVFGGEDMDVVSCFEAVMVAAYQNDFQ